MITRSATLLATLASMLAADACSDATTEAAKPIMTAVSAITQQGTVNQFVASKPTVRVTDASGQPVVGATVVFSVEGEAPPTITTGSTGSDGTASMAWRLSRTSGTQTVVAQLSSAKLLPLGPTITFTAVALADTLAGIQAASVAAQVGFAFRDVVTPPTVVVVDEFLNPKPEPGIEVTFEVADGIGTVTPAKVTTDSTGRATVGAWTLGAGLTTDTLIARVQNRPPVYFTARVVPPFIASSLVSGYQNNCAIANGDVYCWGDNTYGQVTPTSQSPFSTTPQRVLGVKAVSLASGYAHTCAISTDVPPQAYCWGDNAFGELGVPTPGPGPVRVPVAEGLAVVTTGIDHSCGLTPAGVAYCWGNGAQGQLGNGGTGACSGPVNDVLIGCPGPQPVSGNLRFVAIAAGFQYTCGLVANGQMYCWGLDDGGNLGSPGGSLCEEPTTNYPYGSVFDTVSCALTPQVVAGAPAFAAIAAGTDDVCALTPDGSVTCFGPPSGRQVVSSAHAFTGLASDGSCGIDADGATLCWIGSFDLPHAPSFAQPQSLVVNTAFSAITAASNFSRCGILKSNGSAVCWGSNERGQLGTGSTSGSIVPQTVAFPPPPPGP